LDQTTYFATAPVAQLELLLSIEADRMARLKIPATEVESERGAVLTEMHGYENNPKSVLHDNVLYVSFLAHAYRNNTIGWESDVAHISHAQLVEFYTTHYQPGNAVLAIVGDVSTGDTMQLVTRYFAGLKASVSVPEPHTAEPLQIGERRIRLQAALDRKYFEIVYRAPSVVSRDYPAFLLTQELLAAGSGVSFLQNDWGTPARPGSALAGISDDLTTWFPPSAQDYVFTIAGSIAAGGDEKEIEHGIEGGISDLLASFRTDDTASVALLDAARQRVMRELTFDVQTTEDAAHQLAYFAGLEALDVLLGLRESLQQVGTGDIHRVLEHYLGSEKRTVGWYVPARQMAQAETQPLPTDTVSARSRPGHKEPTPSLQPPSGVSLRRLSNGTPVIMQRSNLSATAMLKVLVPPAEFSLPAGVRQDEPALGLFSLDFEILPDEVDQAIIQVRGLLESSTSVGVSREGDSADPELLLQNTFRELLGFRYAPAASVSPVLLVITGDINPADELSKLEASFGSLPTGTWVIPAEHEVATGVEIEKNTRFPVAQAQLGYLVPVPGPREQTAIAWQMALYILSHGYEGRLGKEAISRRGLVYYIDSAYHTDGKNDWITLSVGVDPDKLPAMKKLLREELERLLADPPSPEEVDEARAHMLGRYVSAKQSNRELADGLTRQWIFNGSLPNHDDLAKRLANVSQQDIIKLLPSFVRGTIISIKSPKSG